MRKYFVLCIVIGAVVLAPLSEVCAQLLPFVPLISQAIAHSTKWSLLNTSL
jgi:hypothetical protein